MKHWAIACLARAACTWPIDTGCEQVGSLFAYVDRPYHLALSLGKICSKRHATLEDRYNKPEHQLRGKSFCQFFSI